ncbi:MAG: aminoacyl-tRNA hydrolase [Myxococcota bacterium]
MKLLVGLGNPGRRYQKSRHNVGFAVALRFAADHGIAVVEEDFDGLFGRGEIRADGGPVEVGVLQPLTFMNLSGDAVRAALAELPVDAASDLLVVYDDVDLPFGRLRLRHAGGAGGHNGLGHVLESLGHRDVPRLRFGVGRPPPGHDTRDYVLEGFSPDEREALPERLAEAADAATLAFTAGVEAAMNRYNRDPEAEPPRAG